MVSDSQSAAGSFDHVLHFYCAHVLDSSQKLSHSNQNLSVADFLKCTASHAFFRQRSEVF